MMRPSSVGCLSTDSPEEFHHDKLQPSKKEKKRGIAAPKGQDKMPKIDLYLQNVRKRLCKILVRKILNFCGCILDSKFHHMLHHML